jgi:hypothetical protein
MMRIKTPEIHDSFIGRGTRRSPLKTAWIYIKRIINRRDFSFLCHMKYFLSLIDYFPLCIWRLHIKILEYGGFFFLDGPISMVKKEKKKERWNYDFCSRIKLICKSVILQKRWHTIYSKTFNFSWGQLCSAVVLGHRHSWVQKDYYRFSMHIYLEDHWNHQKVWDIVN